MLLLGIDDAGRGPLIGPMVLAGVLMSKSEESRIKGAGAKDSKLLSHSERLRIADFVKKNSVSHKVVTSSPEQIDSSPNLNTLEAEKAAQIINFLNPRSERVKVIVDCPSVNLLSWKNTMMSFVEHSENLVVLCEHKADFNHASVAAASILAKVRREAEVSRLKGEFGNFGSGYPSDPLTKEFLRKRGRALADSGIFRKSWSTWKKLFPDIALELSGKGSSQQKLF